jgi:hypothetical protein
MRRAGELVLGSRRLLWRPRSRSAGTPGGSPVGGRDGARSRTRCAGRTQPGEVTTSRPCPKVRWITWAVLLVVVVLGVVLPADRVAAQPDDPPATSQCEMPSSETRDAFDRYMECLRRGGTPPDDTGSDQQCRLPTSDTASETRRYLDCIEARDQESNRGTITVTCKDNGWWFFDSTEEIQIPRNSEPWWVDEVREDEEGCALAEHPPTWRCDDERRRDRNEDQPGLVPDKCWGTYPTSLYKLTWKPTDWDDIGGRMMGFLASFMFAIGKGAISISLWIVEWALTFNLTDYTSFASELAGQYEADLIVPLKLEDVFWFVLVAWACFTALRGKLSMVAGEVAVTLLLASLGAVVMANREDYMCTVSARMDESSGAMLAVAAGEEIPGKIACSADGTYNLSETGVRRVLRPLQQTIHREFVERPYAYLQWGDEPTSTCLEAQNNIVATGFDGGGWASRYMEREGCRDEANFNASPSDTRMLGALLTMIAALVTSVLLGLTALTVVMSKFVVAVLFVLLPFAVAAAILPGAGRRVAWQAAGVTLQMVAAVTLSGAVLALMLGGVSKTLNASQDFGLVERWVAVLAVVAMGYLGRRRALGAAKAFGEAFSDTMTRMSPAAAHWQGHNTGVDLLGIDRGVQKTGRGLKQAAFYTALGLGTAGAVVGQYAIRRAAERRVANRAYRNLERIEHWRRGLHEPTYEIRYRGRRLPPGGPSGGRPTTTRPSGGPRGTPPAGQLPPGGRPITPKGGPSMHPGGGAVGARTPSTPAPKALPAGSPSATPGAPRPGQPTTGPAPAAGSRPGASASSTTRSTGQSGTARPSQTSGRASEQAPHPRAKQNPSQPPKDVPRRDMVREMFGGSQRSEQAPRQEGRQSPSQPPKDIPRRDMVREMFGGDQRSGQASRRTDQRPPGAERGEPMTRREFFGRHDGPDPAGTRQRPDPSTSTGGQRPPSTPPPSTSSHRPAPASPPPSTPPAGRHPQREGRGWESDFEIVVTGRVPGIRPERYSWNPRAENFRLRRRNWLKNRPDQISLGWSRFHPIRNRIRYYEDRARFKKDFDRANRARMNVEDWFGGPPRGWP